MRKELRRIVELPPVLFYKEDLTQLEELLKKDINWDNGDFQIDVEHDSIVVSANSVTELPPEALPRCTDSVRLAIAGRNADGRIENGVTINFHCRYAQYQIHAISETWFAGRISQLNTFFNERKPWYAWLNRVMPPLTGGLPILSLMIIGWSYTAGWFWASALATILFVSIIIVGWLSFKQKLFPYIRICFHERPKRRVSHDQIVIVLELAILVATLVSIIVPLMSNP